MTAVVDPRVAADVDVLGVGRTRVHAHLAAQHEPAVGLAHDPQRGALGAGPDAADAPMVAAPAQNVRKRPVRAIVSRYRSALAICSADTLRCRTPSRMPSAMRCP